MKRLTLMALLILLLAMVLPAGAQDMTPSVSVGDQVSLDGTVLVGSAYSEGPGWIVIHADNGSGGPGPVIGHALLNPGANTTIRVDIDTAQATPVLFAMLHTDSGEAGVYEFGSVEGADGPVRDADGNVITPSFNLDLIDAPDQLVSNNSVTISAVVAQVAGWLVVHQSIDGAPGPVAGYAPVSAGLNTDVTVSFDMNEPTAILYPMLHVDSDTIGTYEFGTVQGADGPVNAGGRTAVVPMWTIPHMRVADQIALHGDGMDMADMTPVVVAKSVLAAEDGWLVIHTGTEDGPGPVAGYAPVRAGTNLNVEVTLDMNAPSALLWPMLHVDTGEAGVYEFGTVPDTDGPVMVEGNILTFPIHAAPMILFEGGLEDTTLTVSEALIDAPGWLAIHADDGGVPGPVIAHAPLRPGMNAPVRVTVDPAQAGSQVFPMLHYDTGEAGVYEFGSVPDTDGPVSVNGAVVVGPLVLDAAAMESPEGDGEAMMACSISGANVNMRSGPGTDFEVAGQLAADATMSVTGQTQGTDGYVWYTLDDGSWVRSDVVTTLGDCETLPMVEAPAGPAATEEVGN